MRTIEKTEEPKIFEEWKAKENSEWQPRWNNLQNPEKKCLAKRLLKDQNGLCCYCECEIDIGSSHIEHIRPRSKYEHLELEFSNLVASCQKETTKGMPLTCGKAREDWYDPEVFLDPTLSETETKVKYLMDGRIVPVSEENRISVEKLNLDSMGKRLSRLAVISIIVDDVELTVDDVQKLVAAWTSGDSHKAHPSALTAAAKTFFDI